jgi:hypothetical protein
MQVLSPSLPLSTRIECFTTLGKELGSLSPEAMESLAAKAKYGNPWFVEENVAMALHQLALMLEEDSLVNFVLQYPALQENRAPKTVGVVMAGNIPAVGFHDVLCVLLSGNKLLAKLSKDDTVLIQFLLDRIVAIEPLFAPYIQVTERLANMDAVICTGSNNSARYFESYFGKYPHIIRKNRTSVAVLDGTETMADLHLLATDVLTYFGLGCRNVSKIYIPESMAIESVIDGFAGFSDIVNQHKYANNYTYNRAIYLLNQDKFLDNDFLLFKESENLHAPLAVLFYEKYEDQAALLKKLADMEDQIQCISSKIPHINNRIPLGQTQQPKLSDFADGVDTMEFLITL